jgi:SAM-dependent methyltransferase
MSGQEDQFVQQDQPPGVPPLVLTGERTLPDVPAENYWYRRHEAAYEWIAERIMGRRVVDLACGANPEAFEHARAKYTTRTTRFERGLIDTWDGDVDCVVFLQTIEHVEDPDVTMAHILDLIGETGIAFISTPNVLTLAPSGANKSDNPWHVREYQAREFRELCERHFGTVDLYGLFHARKLALHALALKLGWDRLHRVLRITKTFYDRFTPAIRPHDFQLRLGNEDTLDRALDFIAVCRP